MSQPDLLLAIDKGTTVTKAVVFDPEGRELGVASVSTTYRNPRPGWSEEEPEAVWGAVAQCVRGALTAAGVPGTRIRVIGVTATMAGAWLVDSVGRPVGHGISWIDQRAAGVVQRWQTDGTAAEVFASTGNTLLAGHTMPLLRWLADHEPDRLAQARHVLLPKDWLRFRMTGKAATDPTDLSWLPADPVSCTHSPRLLELLGLTRWRTLLPEAADSASIGGHLLAEPAADLGLPAGVPVVVGMGDACAGQYGLGAVEPGHAAGILGTSLINGLTTDTPVFDPPGTGFLLRLLPDRWVRMLNNTGGGSINLQWALDTFGARLGAEAEASGTTVYTALERLVGTSPPGARGVIFHPYVNDVGVTAPFHNLDAAGNFFGLRRDIGLADMLRAVLEGVALSMRDCLGAVPAPLRSVRLAGGGARNPTWCQIIADVLGVRVEVPTGEETTAKGVALLGATGVGLYPDPRSAVSATVRLERVYEPDGAHRELYDELFGAYVEVRSALDVAWRHTGAVRRR